MQSINQQRQLWQGVLHVILIFSMSTLINSHEAHAQDCEELAHYRDGLLAKQFNQAFDNYKLNSEAIQDLHKIRQETLDERGWNKMFDLKSSMSDGALTTAIIAKNIQTACNLIQNLIKLNPAATYADKTAKSAVISSEKVLSLIRKGTAIQSIVGTEAEEQGYKAMLANSGPVGQAVSTAWQFAKDVQEMTALTAGRDGLKKEVSRILDLLDHAVEKYQSNLTESQNRIETINKINVGITKYLVNYCKNGSPAKNKPSSAVRKIAGAVAPTQRSGVATGKSMYIFLTTSITIDGKSTTLLSAPILYDGPLGDPMVMLKEQYIKAIGEQIAEKEEDWAGPLRSENYQAITVHYAKPYSVSLLKSESDCYAAIEEYVAMMRSTVAGLTYANTLNFVKLK